MKIEILTIGDEILSGNIVDTNFAWLGDKLWSMGFDLHWHTTVGDEPETIASGLLAAVGRSQAVLVTGGLGPTLDDITLEIAARTFGLPLILNEEALGTIRGLFKKIGREMTPNNMKQAMLPQGSTIIPNKVGTAPGCALLFKGTRFFFMPGVPQEMQQQFIESVLPALFQAESTKKAFVQKILRCFGAPEANIAQKLEGINLEGVDLAYRLSFPEILLKVSARGEEPSPLEEKVSKVEQEIRFRLGDLVYGEGEDSFAALVGQLLISQKATVAMAESCTGGELASLMTNIPGSSHYFDCGAVTYSNVSKNRILGVPESVIKTFGAVSSETAVAMAKGIRRVSQATYGLAVTGIAGPEGGTPTKPVGTVYIALDAPDGSTSREFHFPTNRKWFKKVVAYSAMDLLRKKLKLA